MIYAVVELNAAVDRLRLELAAAEKDFERVDADHKRRAADIVAKKERIEDIEHTITLLVTEE